MTSLRRSFPCPRTARSRVCVRVRVRACASYMVLPSFPWRASRSVHDGRRPFFSTSPRTARSRVRVRLCASYVVLPSFPLRASRSVHDGPRPFFHVSTYSPFTGPCTCVCVVHGFAQFSMARVMFRPRRASACFFPCPRTARSRVVVVVLLRACPSYVVLPSFPLRASRFLHDGPRPFFHVSTYSPFTGPSPCVCVLHGFAQFSMARVTFRPRRASAVFFTCPRTARSQVRVRVRVRACASYVVLPSFPC